MYLKSLHNRELLNRTPPSASEAQNECISAAEWFLIPLHCMISCGLMESQQVLVHTDYDSIYFVHNMSCPYIQYIRYTIYFISGRKRIPIATFRKSQVPMLVVLLLNIYICPTPSLCHCCAWAPNVPIAPFVAAWRRRSSAPRTGCGKSGDCGCRPNCQICRWWHGVFLRFLTKGHRCICMKE